MILWVGIIIVYIFIFIAINICRQDKRFLIFFAISIYSIYTSWEGILIVLYIYFSNYLNLHTNTPSPILDCVWVCGCGACLACFCLPAGPRLSRIPNSKFLHTNTPSPILDCVWVCGCGACLACFCLPAGPRLSRIPNSKFLHTNTLLFFTGRSQS